MFCSLSQNYQHLFENNIMHLIVNCPRNSKIASKFLNFETVNRLGLLKSRPGGSWVIDPHNILNVLIHNLKTAWSTKISMPFLSSLDNLLSTCPGAHAQTLLLTHVEQDEAIIDLLFCQHYQFKRMKSYVTSDTVFFFFFFFLTLHWKNKPTNQKQTKKQKTMIIFNLLR